MSEKRYEIIWGTVWVVDEEGEEELWNPQIVKTLNGQQATISALKEENEQLKKEIEESRITIQLYETDVSMRDNFLKSKGLYDEFLQCIWTVNE